jgi:hypothetical protein
MRIDGHSTRVGTQTQLVGAALSSPRRVSVACGGGDTFAKAEATNRLKGAASSGVQGAALECALDKMANCAALLAGAESLDSAVAQIMREQSKQSDDACSRAQGRIQDNYKQMKHETQQRRLAVEKRREAMEDKSWWEKLVNVFKKVCDLGVAVVGGVASACTGNGVGVVSAALKIAGFAVSESGDGDKARWTGFGLSAAGGLLGGLAKGGEGAEKVAQKVGDVGNGVVQGVAAAAIGDCEHDAFDADADLQDLRAERRRAQNAVEQEQELIKAYVEAQTRGMQLASKVLKSNKHVARLAMNEQ